MRVEEFIENNIEYIDINDWNFINNVLTIAKPLQPHQIGKFYSMMLECDINPLNYRLNDVPSYFLWTTFSLRDDTFLLKYKDFYVPDNCKILKRKCFANCDWLESVSLPHDLMCEDLIFSNTPTIKKIIIRIPNNYNLHNIKYCETYCRLLGQIPKKCKIEFRAKETGDFICYDD